MICNICCQIKKNRQIKKNSSKNFVKSKKFIKKCVKNQKNIGHNIWQGTSKNIKVHISVNDPHFG